MDYRNGYRILSNRVRVRITTIRTVSESSRIRTGINNLMEVAPAGATHQRRHRICHPGWRIHGPAANLRPRVAPGLRQEPNSRALHTSQKRGEVMKRSIISL